MLFFLYVVPSIYQIIVAFSGVKARKFHKKCYRKGTCSKKELGHQHIYAKTISRHVLQQTLHSVSGFPKTITVKNKTPNPRKLVQYL